MGKVLSIVDIKKKYDGDKHVIVEFHINNGEKDAVLWYRFEKEFEQYVCIDRCDTAVVTLTLAAMKKGYDVIQSDYPISEKLYYNLQYHVIPQLFIAGKRKISKIEIKAPLTKEVSHGPFVATGMSRGVDSFATMYEYGENFELEDYRVNLFTYFQAGAHHGFDAKLGRGKESKQELYMNQMEETRKFCEEHGYPLLVVSSNISEVLHDKVLFKEKSFDRTHTFRNLGIAMLFQKGISKYYYSSTYNLNDFKLGLNADMAYYERWLIPHLSTGSIEYYQSNQNWTRMEKVQNLAKFETCYDALQVCLTQTGNCGRCMKCRRTLMELDALGGDVLDRFKNSFDVETYRKENREAWFATIVEDKEAKTSEAHYFDETFVCALENHPELIGDLIKSRKEGVKSVVVKKTTANVRKYPSALSEVVSSAKLNDRFTYCGACGPWVGVKTEDGTICFISEKMISYEK